MNPKQITIAVTLYRRRRYLGQAIASALNQTVPVRVIVVEDCGPDPDTESFVKKEFGDRVQYFRNPKRRGIFGNWNACLDLCQTEWISILHDDDYLCPTFVESMIGLAKEAPGRGLYFGQTVTVDEQSERLPDPLPRRVAEGCWMPIGLADALYITPFAFPGHLFPVALAKTLGGFRETSYFCGDWEMWANLIAKSGAAQTGREVAFNRAHTGWDRGCTQIVATGRLIPVSLIQHKRVLALMRRSAPVKYDRAGYIRSRPVSVRFLLRYGQSLPRRLFEYHVRLLALGAPPHWGYAVFQQLTRIFGPRFVKGASAIWNRLPSQKKGRP